MHICGKPIEVEATVAKLTCMCVQFELEFEFKLQIAFDLYFVFDLKYEFVQEFELIELQIEFELFVSLKKGMTVIFNI
jgi:hypothetical protein